MNKNPLRKERDKVHSHLAGKYLTGQGKLLKYFVKVFIIHGDTITR